MIIDSHEHVMLPAEFQLEKMEAAGIDKTILFCTTPHPEEATTLEELKKSMEVLFETLAGNFSKESAMENRQHAIQELAAILQKYPDKFYGFGPVPLELTIKETTAWIQTEILDNGLKGIGEFTPGSDEQMRQLEPIFQVLEKFPQLPIWVHTFNPVSLNGLTILMEFVKKYPSVSVIFGHMGGYNWMNLIEFAKTVPNAFIDLSAAFSTLAVRMAMTELPDKCLFSSDAPYGEPFLSKQMVEYVSPSDEITKKVLGDNILQLLGEK